MNKCTHYFDKRESDGKDYCTLCGIELFEWATQLHAQNQQLIETINSRPAPVATVEAQMFDAFNRWWDEHWQWACAEKTPRNDVALKAWNAALAAHLTSEMAEHAEQYRLGFEAGQAAHPTPQVGGTQDRCLWTLDVDGFYNTGCGQAYVYEDGTPKDNGVNFCQYCGKAVQHLAP